MVRRLRYSARNPNGPDWYTHTFTSAYEGWESWQEKTVAGSSTNNSFKPTTNTLTLDAYGRITQQRESTVGASIDDRVRVYTYSGDGMAQTRREGTVSSSNVFTQSTKAPNNTPQNFQFVFAGGQQLAELQAGGEVRTSQPQTNSLSKIASISGGYTAGGGTVTVLEGEKLQDVAQRVYGTRTLWYVLADANGYSDTSLTLTAGVQLKTPSVGVNSNDANTFKPYNPNAAIGNTTPSLPFIPPAKEAGCNSLVTIIMVVVAIVVTVYTAGAMTGVVGAGFSSTMGAGMATLAGAGGAGLAVGAAAVGGFVGSVASQAVGSALGATTFSWRNALVQGAVAGATAGFGSAVQAGQLGGFLQGNAWASAAATAVTGNIANYAANRIFGNEASFSWKSVAASAISAGVATAVSPAIANGLRIDPLSSGGQAKMGLLDGVLGGVASVQARRAFGFGDKVDYGSVLSDSIGNLIGNAASGRYRYQAERAIDALDVREAQIAKQQQVQEQQSGSSQQRIDALFGRGGMTTDYGYNATLSGTGSDTNRLANIAADRPASTAVRFGSTPRRSSDLSWLQSAMQDYARYGSDFDINGDGQRNAYDLVIVTGLKGGQPGFSGTGDGYLRYLWANNRPKFEAANQLFGRGDYNRWAGQYGYQTVAWTANTQQEAVVRQNNASRYNQELKAYLGRAYAGRANTTAGQRRMTYEEVMAADRQSVVDMGYGFFKEGVRTLRAAATLSNPWMGVAQLFKMDPVSKMLGGRENPLDAAPRSASEKAGGYAFMVSTLAIGGEGALLDTVASSLNVGSRLFGWVGKSGGRLNELTANLGARAMGGLKPWRMTESLVEADSAVVGAGGVDESLSLVARYAKKPLTEGDVIGRFDPDFANLGLRGKVDASLNKIKDTFGQGYANAIQEKINNVGLQGLSDNETLGMFLATKKGGTIRLNTTIGNPELFSNVLLHEVRHLRQYEKLGVSLSEWNRLPTNYVERYATATNIWQGRMLGVSEKDMPMITGYYEAWR